MRGARSHPEIVAWQLSEELADLIIEITARGPVTTDHHLREQLARASGAAGPNIVEGFGRKTPREFAHYLRIAIGTLRETDTWLQRGYRHGYWNEGIYRRTKTLCDRTLDMTRKLLASKERQIAAEQETHRRKPRIVRGSRGNA